MSSLPPPFAPPKTDAPASSATASRPRHRARTKLAASAPAAGGKDAGAASGSGASAGAGADGNLSSAGAAGSRRGKGRGGGGAGGGGGGGAGQRRGAPSDGSLWRRGQPLTDGPGTIGGSGGGQGRVPGSSRGVSDFAKRAAGDTSSAGATDDAGKPLAPSQVVAQEIARMKSGERVAAVLGGAPGSGADALADRISPAAGPALLGMQQAQQHQRTDRPIQPLPSGASAGKARTKKTKGNKPAQSADAADKTRAGLLARIAAPAEEGEARMETEIRNLYNAQKASPQALEARQKLIDTLTEHLNANTWNWGHPHDPRRHPLRIEPFGSVRFGLATSSSDLDLCLFDPHRPRGFEEKTFRTNSKGEGLPEIYDMRRLGQRLMRLGLAKVQPIPFSNVPICKFEATVDGELIQADLNTNERFGVINSRLLNAYCELHRLVRPLAVFVKFWAKQRGLNDPSGSEGQTSFSSYTLILLLIAFLQTRGILPNLQSEELTTAMRCQPTRFFSTPKRGLGRNRSKARITPSVGWDTTFVEHLEDHPDVWRGAEVDGDLPLRNLAKGFFEWFVGDEDGSEPGLDMNHFVVSIRSGGLLPRRTEFPPAEARASRLNGNGLGNGHRPQLPEGAVSAEDELRQSVEDMAIAAFAQQPAEPASAPTPPPSRPQDSRSSSPIAFGEFLAEPANWAARPLVVQDPFLQERNCAGNIIPDVVDTLLLEMRRALGLIDENASLTEICKSVALEPGFQGNLNGWRKQQLNSEREKARRALARLQGSARGAQEAPLFTEGSTGRD